MKETPANLVWITLESVRAANTSVCGYERDTTPNLNRIARTSGGTSFPSCFAQSMWTPASSASILTGTYLFEHRVGYDGEAKEPLPPDVVTLPQLLREQGYRTACLTPNSYLSDATGLDRGFGKYHWLSLGNVLRERETLLPSLKYLLDVRTYGPGVSLDPATHNQTYIMLETLKRWLGELGSQPAPFFLYTHCPNPHLPYTPPRKWLDRFTDDTALSAEEALALSLETYASRDSMIQHIADGPSLSRDEWAALEAMYDAEISYADEFVGRIFDYVRQLDVGKTIFVVTGDHGDLLGERGILGHNLVLDDRLTNVPMVVHGLDGVEHASGSVVQHVDMTRTVAERLGVTHEQFSGVDLRREVPDFAISQRGIPHFDEYLQANEDFDTSQYHREPVTALRTSDFKYLRSVEKSELFALPDEKTDVSTERADVSDDLEHRLESAIQQMDCKDAAGERADYTDSMKQQLSSLGYL